MLVDYAVLNALKVSCELFLLNRLNKKHMAITKNQFDETILGSPKDFLFHFSINS